MENYLWLIPFAPLAGALLNGALAISFANSGRTVNERQFVSGTSPDKDAVVEIAQESEDDPMAALDAFLAKEAVTRG